MKQEPLEERRKEYIHFCDEQATYYDKAAAWNRKMNAIVQTIIITGAAITPFLLNISQVPKIVPTVLSAIVALVTATSSLFKYEHYWTSYRHIAREITRERRLFDLRVGKYKDMREEEAFEFFVTSVETIMDSIQQTKHAQNEK
jgi:Protein of unknown function (DUF4231)